MRVKIETACFWGEGEARKRYEPGSVIEVPEEVVNQNPWMKPTDADLFDAPAPEEETASSETDPSETESEGSEPATDVEPPPVDAPKAGKAGKASKAD